MSKFQMFAMVLVIILIPLQSISQTCSPTAPVCVPVDGYAFQYSQNTNYGLKFNSATGEYQFTDLGGIGLFNINATNGLVTVKNNLFVENKLGVGSGNTLFADFSVFNAISHFGVVAGYAVFDNDGDLSFTGTADYLVPGNRYAFRYSAAPGYGLFFNSTSSQYEFRTSDASPVLSIEANTGDVGFDGKATIGNVPNDNALTELLVKDANGLVHYRDASTLSSGGGFWTANGSNISYGAGNVGIGTTSPISKLTVQTGNGYGIIHTNGAVRVGSYVNGNGGWYGTSNNYPLFLFTNNSTPQVTLTTSGNVGIGTTSPISKLTVQTGDGYGIIHTNGVVRVGSYVTGYGGWYGTSNNYPLFLFTNNSAPQVTLTTAGNLGIGTTSPQSKLAVNGKITCKEVDVTLSGFPDYVFTDEYELMSLDNLSEFIDRNGHLPNMPTETEVVENGVGLGALNVKLVEKIEELTLHMIEKDTQLKAQQILIEQIQQRLVELEGDIH